ncbi:MAG: hypothetical protein DMENIID0002_06300 [Rickettsia endosymbiont of Sergentomyia squamirostris]|uniref:Uncharacterized protein n=1 Tax=Candidatus Tisiphia endosymbiont of Sergentomyia squamirostris TaxID=3113639 RepID=A0AAT9G858_9RICK
MSKSPAEVEFRKKSNNDMPFMLYEYLNDFNWTMLELMAYEQEIEILWHSLQNNLCEIREQFIGE